MGSLEGWILFRCIISGYSYLFLLLFVISCGWNLTGVFFCGGNLNGSHQTIGKDEFYALLSAADLGVITPLRDGMNTTSMEFVIAQARTKKSPLLLSEFMGISSNMADALQINPWNLGVRSVSTRIAEHSLTLCPLHTRLSTRYRKSQRR